MTEQTLLADLQAILAASDDGHCKELIETRLIEAQEALDPQDPNAVWTIIHNMITIWKNAEVQAKRNLVVEGFMRQMLFEQLFPEPKEGTNKVAVGYGMQMVGKHKVNRTIDASDVAVRRTEIKEMKNHKRALAKFEELLEKSFSRTEKYSVLAAWKDLDDAELDALSIPVTEKDAKPTMSLEPAPVKQVVTNDSP